MNDVSRDRTGNEQTSPRGGGFGRGELSRFPAALDRRSTGHSSRAPLPQFSAQLREMGSAGISRPSAGEWKRACAPARNSLRKESPRLAWTVGPWTMCAWARTDNRSPTPFAIATNAPWKRRARCTRRISPDRLYELTGVQILPLNTLYQLYADRNAEQNLPWVNLPEFLLHHLGGSRVSEYTNATHTQLLDVKDQAWCAEIFDSRRLDMSAAPPLVQPGTDLGRLQGDLCFPACLPRHSADRARLP